MRGWWVAAHRLRSSGRRDDGSISLWVAATFMAILAVAGLVVDGGAKIRAGERADLVAGEAARAASFANGPDDITRTAAAAAAARGILTRSGLTGNVTVAGPGQVDIAVPGQRHRPDQRLHVHRHPQRPGPDPARPEDRRHPMTPTPPHPRRPPWTSRQQLGQQLRQRRRWPRRRVRQGLGVAAVHPRVHRRRPVPADPDRRVPHLHPGPRRTLWRAATGPDLTGRGVFVVLAALVWIGWAWFTLSVLRETAAAIRTRGPTAPPATSRPMSGRTSWSVQPAAILVAAIVAMFVAAPAAGRRRPSAAAAGHPGSRPRGPGTAPSPPPPTTPASGATSTRATSLERRGISVDRVTASTDAVRAPRQPPRRPPRKAASSGRAAATTDVHGAPVRHPVDASPRSSSVTRPATARSSTLNPHLQHDTTIHAGDALTLPQHHSQQTSRPPHHRHRTASGRRAPGAPGSTSRSSWATPSPRSPPTMACRDWRTVWDANKGKAEPGGKHFTDPDHIEVGWDITIPAAAAPQGSSPRRGAGPRGPGRPSCSDRTRLRDEPSQTPRMRKAQPRPRPAP